MNRCFSQVNVTAMELNLQAKSNVKVFEGLQRNFDRIDVEDEFVARSKGIGLKLIEFEECVSKSTGTICDKKPNT